MECFSYKGGCSICVHTHFKELKEELAWTTINGFKLLLIMLFTTAIPLKNNKQVDILVSENQVLKI